MWGSAGFVRIYGHMIHTDGQPTPLWQSGASTGIVERVIDTVVDKQFASVNNVPPEPWTGQDTRDRGMRCLIAPHFLALSQLENTKNCGAHLMLQVRTRILDGTLRRSSSSGIRLKAGAKSVEVEPCAA